MLPLCLMTQRQTTILSLNPDGIMLSNGPGDPKENVEAIEQLKKLVGKSSYFCNMPRSSAFGTQPGR